MSLPSLRNPAPTLESFQVGPHGNRCGDCMKLRPVGSTFYWKVDTSSRSYSATGVCQHCAQRESWRAFFRRLFNQT